MRRQRTRDFLKWLPLLFGLLLMAASAGGCGCDDKSTGENTESTEISTDGGTEKIIKENEPEFDGTCSKRCDCPQGQECSEGKCVSTTTPVYCCDRDGCPVGQACNDHEDKPSVCAARQTCKHSCDCKQGLGCVDGFCTATRNPTYCCERIGCPPGQACESARGGQKTCGDEGAACNTACDCIAGIACTNGQCTRTGQLVYCCEDTNCPTGQRCQNRKGGYDLCQQQQACKTACDCNAGQACNSGKCESQPIPVYCCDKPDACPAGQVCDRSDGQRDKCPSQVQCKSPCDCAQGQDCQNGRCVVNPFPVYCCRLAGCPPNAECANPDGSKGTCSTPSCQGDADCGRPTCAQAGDRCSQVRPTCQRGICTNSVNEGPGVCDPNNGTCRLESQCKVDCDCPQSQACVDGKCEITPPGGHPTYCCIKPGCPTGQSCVQPNGTRGLCPSAKCQIPEDCGPPTCQSLGTDCVQFKPFCDDSGQCGTSRGAVSVNSLCGPDGICGPAPIQCKTPCDCAQGQNCLNNRCITDPSAPMYCCENPGCPPGAKCIDRAGQGSSCKQVSCRSDADCGGTICRNAGNDCIQESFRCDIAQGQCFGSGSVQGNAICDAATNTCKPRTAQCRADSDCGAPSCRQNGQLCQQTIPACSNGTCIGTGSSTVGTCAPDGKCQTATFCRISCDCPQGQSCQASPVGTGVCVQSNPPTYCCDKAGCPAGEKCINTQNQGGLCKGSCLSACDCPAGQDCINGACSSTTPAVYCCDNPSQCPAGAACRDKAGTLKTCPQVQRKCNSPCDCVQGEACAGGFCATTTKPVYCCTAAGCPAGSECFDKNNLRGTCPRPCTTNCDCNQGERCVQGACTAQFGVGYCCSKPGCPANQVCYNTNGSSGRCPVASCTSACNCTQGDDCRNGTCTRVFPPVYCCSNTNCPTGSACINTSGQWSTCGGQPACTSACDCNQGEDCYRGQCIRTSPATYCCEKTGCPSGTACFDSKGQSGVCPGVQCTTACDCNVGQACLRGRCVSTSPATYCCDKTPCPSGNTCEDKLGNFKTCPGKTCKNACDCNQGEDCRGSVCLRVSPAVFCCSKPGCAPNQTCINVDGTSGRCSSTPPPPPPPVPFP